VHVRPALFEYVGCPVPAVGGFEDHLGMLTGLSQLCRQGLRIVVDAHRLEGLAGLVAPHDHAAAPMQVDTDVLSLLFHGDLLSSFRVWCGNPKCARHTWIPTTGGSPRTPSLRRHILATRPRSHDVIPRSAPEPVDAPPELRHARAALRSFMTSKWRPRKRPRRSFSDAYKAEVVELYRTSGKSITEVAQDLGLTVSALRRWVAQGQNRFDTSGRPVQDGGGFDVLRRASQHLNLKLREVAQNLVDTGEDPYTGPSQSRDAKESALARTGPGVRNLQENALGRDRVHRALSAKTMLARQSRKPSM
jgi:transposase-like protein